MDKTDRLRDYGLAFLLYEQGLGICGYELIRELFIFIKLILNSYLIIKIGVKYEVGFIGKRSLLHLASKLASFDFEAYFIFNNIYS